MQIDGNYVSALITSADQSCAARARPRGEERDGFLRSCCSARDGLTGLEQGPMKVNRN